ncbi:UDP-N-acetyl-D-mannosamine dehydrogenase, partial [Sulfurovum sp.]|uniref:UDP-N-acetyl-D-mannosamine dehydrogenase n=1 Tax=Sulfurovum sp. TaxID=1969726 RepID=UPI0025CEA722
MKFNSICMIGLGYIGLPTAGVFAKYGVTVKGVDINQHAVDTINRGKIHIEEPGLEELVKSAVDAKRLSAYTTPQKADAFIMAVPTPFKGEDHEPNLDYIEAATRSLAKVLEKGNLVILESTSPVGTTEKMAAWLAEERPDLTFPQNAGEESDIRVTHCPERILPGQMIRELVENDRVIGGMTPKCTKAAADLYKTFVKGECVETSARIAEMSKLTENAFRDVNIAFANELSLLCDKMGISVWELIEMANKHPRVNILQPGCGVGGHCIAVDPWFIVNAFPHDAHMIRTARETNDGKP